MKLSKELPPNYQQIAEAFDLIDYPGVVFTYGDTCYNVQGELPDHLRVHELTHTTQQADNPDAWWDKYIADATFRLAQEVEAYRNQYRYFCQTRKDRNLQARFLSHIATDLSSTMYGSIVSYLDAMRLIRG